MRIRIKKAVCICVLFICTFVLAVQFDNSKDVSATAIGVVNVSGYLNVRVGPGTSYDLLKSGGTGVTLSEGQRITITAKNGDWYHVKFNQNGKALKGYVLKKYVKVQMGEVCTNVAATVAQDSLKLRAEASDDSAFIKSNKTEIILEKETKVKIKNEKTVDNQKWYYVLCTYSSKSYRGYVKAESLTVLYDKEIPGIWQNAKKGTLCAEAGGNAVKSGNTTVTLNKGKQFNITSETNVSGERYFYVKLRFNDKTVKGYLPAKYVKFQIVKVENSNTPAETEAPASTEGPSETGEPDKTSEPASSDVPSETTEPNNTQEPVATPTPAPLTDEEFKKKLENEGFPESYIEPLMRLHAQYPNWEFKAFITGLKWDTVINKESVVGLNLLSNNKSYDWKSTEKGAYDWTTDKYIPYDGSTWVTASKKAVKYYMDPRNFLDERGIFMFELLEYISSTQSQEGVEKILKNTPMYNTKFSYPNSDGNDVSIKYSKAFIKAAETSKVSPYHLASRVKQEVVIGPELMSSSVSGKVKGYEGIYNFYNIGAYNSTEAGGAIANGLKWASSGDTYNRPWDNIYKSIVGGAQYIGKNYINVGQNTLYLEKFNVTAKNRYEHQYMANVEAPNSEATKTVSAYGVIDSDMSITFSIPVYEDMPESPCEVPSGGKNPNNYLKTLYVQNHPFTSKFKLGDDGSKTYKLTVDKSVESIKICATKVSTYSTVTGKGSKTLKDGVNTFTVKVTSESGSSRKYKIQVTRQ